MKTRRGLIVSIPFLFFLLLLIYFGVRHSRGTTSLSPSFSTDFAYDNRTFFPAVLQYPSLSQGSSPSVMVVPHHLTASNIIARGISLLTADPPKTIILLSPNHANTGQCDIISSSNSWDTPYGQIQVDKNLLGSFVRHGTVCLDDQALVPEHGLAGLMPFLAFYLPNTQVVPFALKKNLDQALLDSFIQQLITASPDTVIIASVDFSHGLTRDQATQRDDQTENFIYNHSYQAIEKLSSEYLDSPASLISALKIIRARSLVSEVLVHTDSYAFNHIPESVTSYYLLIGHMVVTQQSSVVNTIPSPTGIRDLKSEITSTTLLFGGDVMLGRSVGTRIAKNNDPSWPFKKISSILNDADLTFINLESPFGSECKSTDTGMVFCADPISVKGLVGSGVDIANLANNHIDNQGNSGFDLTISTLNQNQIAPVGLGKPVIKTVKNTKIAFLGFNDTPPNFSQVSASWPVNVSDQIIHAKSQADIVIASFHWGNEYSHRSLHQVELAHMAIDSGADAVIGHHPHWVQEIETYLGKPIYYSLGNLVFDQMWSEETRKGILVKLTYSGSKLIGQEKIPIKIFDYGQPVLDIDKF